MERLDRIALNTSFSIHSIAEGSEVISEVEEIQEVHNLQCIGNKALETENFEEALHCYDDALEIDENNIDCLCGRAEVYLYLGKYALAQVDAERVLAIIPRHSEALVLQGQALGNLGYHREALVVFLKALDLVSDSDEKSSQLASHVANMAAEYCSMPDRLIQKLPAMESYKKLCEVGACLYQARQYDLSIRVLNAAQKLETNQKGITMKVLLTLANAHSALKHNELAISLYQDCLSAAQSSHDIPYQTKSLVSIASLFLELGETHQAIMYYEKLLDLQRELQGEKLHGPLPDYWSKDLQCALHLNMSIAYKSIGDLNQAQKHAIIYMKLIEGKDLLRENAEALSQQNLGVLLDILGRYDEALKHFEMFHRLSRQKGDKKGVSQAYGSLGNIYAKLGNVSLARAYHKQSLNTAKGLTDAKLITLSHEQYGDTCMYLNDLDEAVQQYLHMFRSTSRTDPQSQTQALCKLGKAYRAQNHYQHSIYYFEQANIIAQDYGLDSVNMICEYNLACILQHSTQMKELNKAKAYLERLVPMLEVKVMQHTEEATFCSEELLQELQECYGAMQTVLCKLGENNLALLYAEASKWRYLSENINPGFSSTVIPGFSLWDMDKVRRVVNQQNATILYYTLLHNSYMLWVLQPGRGVVRFYEWKNQDKSTILHKSIEQLVKQIKEKDRQIHGNELKYENRSIPYKDEDLIALRKKYEKLKSDGEDHDARMTEDQPLVEPPILSSPSPEKALFKILIAPVYDLLADLEKNSSIIVIPDGCLYECPFSALKDWSSHYLGDRFSISNITNLYLLDQATQNELNWLKMVDEREFERSQSRLGGVLRNLVTSPVRPDGDIHCGKQCQSNNIDTLSSIDSDAVNLKRTSNPRLITSGVFSSREEGDPSLTNRESVFTTARSKNTTSPILSSRRMNKKQNDVPEVPQTARCPAPGPAPTSLEKMLSLHCLSTLTKTTSTNTDIVTSACHVTEFRQVCDRDRCVVIGNPALPERLQLHGREWQQVLDLRAAEAECHEVAKTCDVTAISGPLATKDRFLKEIQDASLIHIATRMCHREGYLIFSPNEDCDGQRLPPEKSYIVTSQEIEHLSLTAKLVVLSGGWSIAGKPSHHQGYRIESALIAAGAQCVLTLLWALPDTVLTDFYHHFYATLHTGNKVAAAVREAVNVIKKDERYHSIAYWSPWQLVGKDTILDLVQMRHAMLDQELNRIEEEVGEQSEKAKLNPDPVTPYVANKEENLSTLQECMALLLSSCNDSHKIITSLIDLMDEALRRLHNIKKYQHTTELPDFVINHHGAMELLRLLDFHFQSKGASLNKQYVVFPHWNKDNLLMPTFEALRAVNEIISNSEAVRAFQELFPLSQDTISQLVDVLAITKNAADIQLKVTDLSVKSLWTKPKIHLALMSIGFQQIGVLLKFNNIPSNRRLLSASLQLMIALSIHKNPVLLHKLDVNLLGLPSISDKNSSTSLSLIRLPSLMPVMLPRQQIRMSTPWLTRAERVSEMDEKVHLARSKTELSVEFLVHQKRAKTWHQESIKAQANEALDLIGKPTSKPLKVKVIKGSSLSSISVPVDHQAALSNTEADQRRDYASDILKQRLEDLDLRRRNEERRLYLPYIVNA